MEPLPDLFDPPHPQAERWLRRIIAGDNYDPPKWKKSKETPVAHVDAWSAIWATLNDNYSCVGNRQPTRIA